MFSMNRVVQFVLRYKILHVLFWFLKTILLYHQMQVNSPANGVVNWVDSINASLTQMLCVYTAIYVLIPRLVVKEKYVQFAFAVLLLIATCTLLDLLVQMVYLKLIFRPGYQINMVTLLINYIGEFVEMTMVATLFIIFALAYHFYQRDQKNRLL